MVILELVCLARTLQMHDVALDVPDCEGVSPLAHALRLGDTRVAKALLECGLQGERSG